MIRLASEKRSERAFQCLGVFREFTLDASKTASFSVFIILYAVRGTRIGTMCLSRITVDGSRRMMIHIRMNPSNLNVDLNTCEPGGLVLYVPDLPTLARPFGPAHIARRQSTFILEHIKLNI